MSSKERSDDDIVDRTSLSEIATDVFYLSKYRNIEGDFDKKKKTIIFMDCGNLF